MTFELPFQDTSFKVNDQKDRKMIQQKQTGPIKIKHDKPAKGKKIALIGWSIPTMEAMDRIQRPYIVVSLPEFQDYADKHEIPFYAWQFDKDIDYEQVYQKADPLFKALQQLDVDHAIPLFEETVEWAGALNAYFRQEPKIFHHSILFRDKAMMKRRAHMGGLKVGVFEEATNKDQVHQFFRRVNASLLRHHEEDYDPIHVKALNKAGAAGHRMIRSEGDIDTKLADDNFPCLVESHLKGIEVSCEAFIHEGNVLFLNITEYIVFGYSMMVPPSPEIEKYRPAIHAEVQKLVDSFDISYGIIHPEFFITDDEELYFGEVAYRIPGGHIFDLMQKTYGFNPYEGHILCSDPNTPAEEVKGFFPKEDQMNGHAGSFLVYPKKNTVQGINIPDELEEHPGFDKHTLFKPMQVKVQDQEGYGNHLGTVFFHHEDYQQVKQPLADYVEHDFFM
ncbi:ATP-grasp domain-containing protein [Gracilibacillus orientalis]|uniref:ATP-grasp domain-containing protein n=1 Tax=Gracilibacillus orientalis TaxID=334253 RepID=A0A1I4K9I2_9BACI|nr:ATP-grasp domain-containing protein [Gracilibacillus orientalis]SFL75394.1 ATP-grasp domain-containing protein [Gracilibacillus orientalis]